MMAKQFSSMLHVATASRDPNETWTAKVGKTQKNTKIHLRFFINKHVFCLYFMCFVFLFCFLVRPHHCSQLHKSIPELLDLRKSVSGSRTVASVRTVAPHESIEIHWNFWNPPEDSLFGSTLIWAAVAFTYPAQLGVSKLRKTFHVAPLHVSHVSCTCWDGIWFTASVVAHGWLPIQWTPHRGTQNHVSQFGTCFHGFQTFFQARRA